MNKRVNSEATHDIGSYETFFHHVFEIKVDMWTFCHSALIIEAAFGPFSCCLEFTQWDLFIYLFLNISMIQFHAKSLKTSEQAQTFWLISLLDRLVRVYYLQTLYIYPSDPGCFNPPGISLSDVQHCRTTSEPSWGDSHPFVMTQPSLWDGSWQLFATLRILWTSEKANTVEL